MGELRWGVLGAARITAAKAIPAINTTPGARLQAVASRDYERAAAMADRFSARRAYSDYAALLDDPEIDAVYIALPNAMHVEWTLAALDRGKAVLCEKPLAADAESARRVIDRAAASRVLVAEGFMYRFHPQTERLFDLVDDGAVGVPVIAGGAMSFLLSDCRDIRADPELGGGVLLDLGCYVVDALCRLFGGPAVRAAGGRVLGPSKVDETTAAVLEFSRDRLGGLEVSFRQPWTESRFEVRGDAGTLRAPHAFNPGGSSPTTVLIRPGRDPAEFSFPRCDMFAAMFRAFGAAVTESSEYPFPFNGSVARTLELITDIPATGGG